MYGWWVRRRNKKHGEKDVWVDVVKIKKWMPRKMLNFEGLGTRWKGRPRKSWIGDGRENLQGKSLENEAFGQRRVEEKKIQFHMMKGKLFRID